MGESIRDAVPFLSATSVDIMMRRWIGIPRLGQGFLVKRTLRSGWLRVPAGAPRGRPANASACFGNEARNAPGPRRPAGEAINLHRLMDALGETRAEGNAPQISRAGNLEKPEHEAIVAGPGGPG